jgi:hypothetical protein
VLLLTARVAELESTPPGIASETPLARIVWSFVLGCPMALVSTGDVLVEPEPPPHPTSESKTNANTGSFMRISYYRVDQRNYMLRSAISKSFDKNQCNHLLFATCTASNRSTRAVDGNGQAFHIKRN